MIDTIIKTIALEMPMDSEELVDFKELLEIVAVNAEEVHIEISQERWLSMGVHLLSTIRRVKKGEKLPTVDPFIVEQVSLEMMELSRKVLQHIDSVNECSNNDTEAVLLALHFETAQNSN
ncbi:PRD domain protein [Pelosinus fermentans JBW45]|uniref:PRD domain protein n=2 Tax=Pelosinus TaxID=365348 RepID=I8TUK9_9FIRM|nr:PRD domain protein [Pelosinus fermentans JBW45]